MSTRDRRADPHRSRYHFSPDHWMNDPIPFFWQGAYHVFFQHNPHAASWGDMHWGHAVSHDLVHWETLPIALAPTPGGPDRDGCWTGCVVASDAGFSLLYTAIPQLGPPLRQVQCLATSRDLLTWQKHPANPVIAAPPPGFGECFRDPCVWRDGDGWRLLLGAELPERRGGAALLYRSPDLVSWRYEHPLYLGDAERTGHDFECPDFFPLDGRHVLLTSRGRTHWHVGRYDAARQTFAADAIGDVDGDRYYAAKTLRDDRGRRLLFGWLREGRPVAEQVAAGWSGVLSLPRTLTLRDDGTPAVAPAPEVQALRVDHRQLGPLTLDGPPDLGDRTIRLLPDVAGDSLEVRIRFAPTTAAGIGILVRCTPDLAERTLVEYDQEAGRFGDLPFHPRTDVGLELRLFIDRSVVEAFANDRVCRTWRTYPSRHDALRLGLCARGGSARVESVDVWTLRPAT